jgi:hypothetical protein
MISNIKLREDAAAQDSSVAGVILFRKSRIMVTQINSFYDAFDFVSFQMAVSLH